MPALNLPLPRTRLAEYAFWALGAAALLYCAYLWLEARAYQAVGARVLSASVPSTKAPSKAAAHDVLPKGALVGQMEIPRLKLKAAVFQGTDDETLNRGVGHLPASALPGRTGNVVLAGHRDSFFRPLQGIKSNDMVTLATPDGLHRYRVTETRVVTPDETSVLRASEEPVLTLITCYPFRFVGNAPKRFVVRAVPEGVAPAALDAPVEATALVPAPKPAPKVKRAVHKPVKHRPAVRRAGSKSGKLSKINPGRYIKRVFR